MELEERPRYIIRDLIEETREPGPKSQLAFNPKEGKNLKKGAPSLRGLKKEEWKEEKLRIKLFLRNLPGSKRPGIEKLKNGK